MKIVDAKVIICCPGRNFVTLKVVTEDGIYGLGDATLNGREPYHLFWMEDPTPAELQESFRLIRQHTSTPLAVGKIFNSLFDCPTLIQEQLIDYIRTTVVHAGGITHLKKIAALAELYQVRTGSHGATDL